MISKTIEIEGTRQNIVIDNRCNRIYVMEKLTRNADPDIDVRNLIEALSPFQVNMRVWEDKKRHEILGSLREILEEVNSEPSKYSGLVILGMSHGEDLDGRDCLVSSDCKPVLTDQKY